jgi:type IV pilus assembly protein PilQ
MGGNLTAGFNGDTKHYNVIGSGIVGAPSTAITLGNNGSTFVDLPAPNPTGGIGFGFGVGDTADLKIELTDMEKKGLSKIISNPRIFTLDNQEAVIFQGSEIPYETISQNGTQVQFKEAGLRLAVTPTVVGDGNLMLSLILNKDSADTTKSNPPITKSQITTNLVTKDNSIVVIGGIYTQTRNDSTSAVPGFGDLPLAGKLFRKDEKSDGKKELMIFISPHIL